MSRKIPNAYDGPENFSPNEDKIIMKHHPINLIYQYNESLYSDAVQHSFDIRKSLSMYLTEIHFESKEIKFAHYFM